MARSVKANFIYNMIGTVSGFLFPMITFPYVSRVIMAEGLGLVQFYNSIINYVVLLTSLGIPLYATREIARVRDNVADLSRTTTEIISLNLILNIVGYASIFIMCYTIDEVMQNIPLFLLLSTSIVLTTIGCPWFFSGVEDFKFITLRGLAVRVVSTIFLFLFVRDKSDLMLYALYNVIASVGANVLNFIRLRKYIRLSAFKPKELNIWRHLKPAFAIFVFNLITSIYVNLDKVMVGFLKDNESVGYYTAATTISHIFLTAVTSLGVVMLPRLSNLVKQGDMESFNRLAKKSYNFIVTMSFPICGGLIILSPSLIRIFSGEGFTPAIFTLQIISPIIVAIGISNLIGLQILYPLGKIKIVIISILAGAIINFFLNLLLIPKYAQNGAAIATVCTEVCVTLTQIIIARKFIPFKIIDKQVIYCLISTFAMMTLCFLFINLGCSDAGNLVSVPIIGAIFYSVAMILSRNALALEAIQMLATKIKRK